MKYHASLKYPVSPYLFTFALGGKNRKVGRKEISMIAKVETLWNNGNSLYDGGIQRVANIVEADGYIVYQVELKNCNRGGNRNSGITQWQGTRAFNGKADLEIKPLRLWRDGENQWNDQPSLRFAVEAARGNDVILRCDNGDRETYHLDFSKKRVSFVKRISRVDWMFMSAKTREDFINVLKSSVYRALDRENPRGSYSVDIFKERGDIVIFWTKQCLYGNPFEYALFEGKIGEKNVRQTKTSSKFPNWK